MSAVLSLCLAFAATACAVSSRAEPPPALIKPVSVKLDMAAADRGNVTRVIQIRGLVRVKSEALYFGETNLRFDTFHCISGQRVEAGELLVQLDCDDLKDRIEAQEKEIARLLTEYRFASEAREIDIAMAQADMGELARAAEGYDEAAMRAYENKRLEIDRLRLVFTQAAEQQNLALRYARAYLNELIQQVADAEIRAPYDGVITYRVNKSPGDRIEPFAPLLYISDETEMFVEYSGPTDVTVGRNDVVKGFIGPHQYDLTRVMLTQQEALPYVNLRITQPIRLKINNPDEHIRPGAYVSLWVYERQVENVVRIPLNALYADSEHGTFVYVMENGGQVIRPVEVGLRSNIYVEITAGLAEGETFFVK